MTLILIATDSFSPLVFLVVACCCFSFCPAPSELIGLFHRFPLLNRLAVAKFIRLLKGGDLFSSSIDPPFLCFIAPCLFSLRCSSSDIPLLMMISSPSRTTTSSTTATPSASSFQNYHQLVSILIQNYDQVFGADKEFLQHNSPSPPFESSSSSLSSSSSSAAASDSFLNSQSEIDSKSSKPSSDSTDLSSSLDKGLNSLFRFLLFLFQEKISRTSFVSISPSSALFLSFSSSFIHHRATTTVVAVCIFTIRR